LRGGFLFLSSFRDQTSRGLLRYLIGTARQSYYDGPYIGGMLSNYVSVRSNTVKLKANNAYSELVLRGFFPSSICVADSNRFFYVYREASSLGLSSIGLVDSDLDFRGVLYPVPSNNESRVLIYFFYLNLLYAIRLSRLFLKISYFRRKVAVINSGLRVKALLSLLHLSKKSMNVKFFRVEARLNLLSFVLSLFFFFRREGVLNDKSIGMFLKVIEYSYLLNSFRLTNRIFVKNLLCLFLPKSRVKFYNKIARFLHLGFSHSILRSKGYGKRWLLVYQGIKMKFVSFVYFSFCLIILYTKFFLVFLVTLYNLYKFFRLRVLVNNKTFDFFGYMFWRLNVWFKFFLNSVFMAEKSGLSYLVFFVYIEGKKLTEFNINIIQALPVLYYLVMYNSKVLDDSCRINLQSFALAKLL
jgi:hypothetical protein